MKAFITKYALTAGIQEVDVEQDAASPKLVSSRTGFETSYYWGEGRDWHRTRESAVARAEEMRQKKLASLSKSIAKLEKLKFT